MRARNEYVKVQNGQNEIVFHNTVLDKYLSLFSKSQYETDAAKLYNYNYNKIMPSCFIKFDESIDVSNKLKVNYRFENKIETTQILTTTNQTITSQQNEIVFNNLNNEDLISYVIQGKCEQEAVIPKNLYNCQDVSQKSDMVTVGEDGWIYVECDNTQGTEVKYLNFWTNNLNLRENINYNIICEVEVSENTYSTEKDNALIVTSRRPASNDGQFQTSMEYEIDSLGTSSIKQQICTSMNDLSGVNYGLRTYVVLRAGAKISLKFRISVLEDTTITTENFIYEPFVNESPSPDYPSEIKTIRKSIVENLFLSEMELGSILGTGELQNNSNAIRTKSYIEIKPNTVYTISNDNNYTNNLYFYDQNKNFISSRTANEFTTPNNANYLKVRSNAGNFQNDLNTQYFLVETEMTKNKLSIITINGTVTINLEDNELNSINDIYDEYSVTTGKLIKRIGKLILNGNENWNRDNSSGSFYPTNNLLTDVKLPTNNTIVANIICSHFKTDSFENSWEQKKENTICISADGNVNPRIQVSSIKTVNEFKTWLQSNPVIIYYELNSERQAQLTPTQLFFPKNEISKDDFDISFSGIANSNGNNQSVITTYFYSAKNTIYNIKNNTTENDLNKYANRKITALGFGQDDIMAYFDTTNYSISIIKDCEFCISRRDIFSSDAICQGYAYPLHLATITPSITYDDNQYYSTVHARLYSIGLGKTVGEIEDEKIIERDINIRVVDDTSFKFIVEKGSNQSIHPKTSLYSRSGLYPMPYYTEIELYPNSISFCSNNKYPLASNYKYIIYKYRLYYINRGGQLVDLDQFYTMSLTNNTKGLFEIITKIERS